MQLVYYWKYDQGTSESGLSCTFITDVLIQEKIIHQKELNKINVDLIISANTDHIANFFELSKGKQLLLERVNTPEIRYGNIQNVSAIIGSNGVGKTSLLQEILEATSGRIPLGEKYILGILDGNQIDLYYSDNIILRVENTSQFESKKKQEGIHDLFEDENLRRKNEFIYPKKSVIYYNPAFDFRGLPPDIERDSKHYIDISTNALLLDDEPEPGIKRKAYDEKDNEYNPIIIHKTASIRRSIDLVVSNLSGIDELNIPKEFIIKCNKYHFTEERRQKNLTSDALKIYSHFLEIIASAYRESSSELGQFENKKQKKGDSFSELEQQFELTKIVQKRTKVDFIEASVHSYFDNLHGLYMKDIGIEDDFDLTSNVEDFALAFFETQTYASSVFDLLSLIFESIDKTAYNDSIKTDSFVSKDYSLLISILSNYQHYLKNVNPSSSFARAFLEMDWRDISTGEKMRLDLFGRLLFAKNKIPKDQTEVLLIIDEGELGFHPQWQKEYFYDLITFVQECFAGKEVQLILTTHSPFLISDLPRQNIILLDKEEQNKVYSRNTDDLESFAANIYDLYKHSFFNEDNSYVGKFALSKIEDVLEYVNTKEYQPAAHKYCMTLVKLISDDIIHSKLVQLLDQMVTEKTSDIDKKERLNRLKQHEKTISDQIKALEDDLGEEG